tara:strand:- start:5631 stop:5909 length:279 start_codon:yes stop_codon:yes gene_type:complete
MASIALYKILPYDIIIKINNNIAELNITAKITKYDNMHMELFTILHKAYHFKNGNKHKYISLPQNYKKVLSVIKLKNKKNILEMPYDILYHY